MEAKHYIFLKKITASRVTKSQKHALLEQMRQNPHLGTGQFSGPDSNKNNKMMWESIAVDLNARGGAYKTAEQWKRCWIDWKASVKKQHSAIKKFNLRTGNLPDVEGPKKLDELDEELVAFFSPHMFEGDSSTREGGFADICPAVAETEEDCVFLNEEYLDLDKSLQNSTSIFKLSTLKSSASVAKKPRVDKAQISLSSQLEIAKSHCDQTTAKQIAVLNSILLEQQKTNMLLETNNTLLQTLLKKFNMN